VGQSIKEGAVSRLDVHPDHLRRSGGTLTRFGEAVAEGGQNLETAGQNLVAHASGDRSGIGAVISRLFGRGIQITGKVFSEGGRVAQGAGQRLGTSADLFEEADSAGARRLSRLHPDAAAGRLPGGAGGRGRGRGTGGGGGGGSRPVKVKVPKWASPEEVGQFERYVAGSNRAVAANALSKTGRVATTTNGVRRDAEKAAYKERKRAEAAGTPYKGVAGHVPDAAWMGQGQPYEWQDMSKRVNSSLSGQIGNYPVGYKPTHFEIEYPPVDPDE
jgi:hypothetical protein